MQKKCCLAAVLAFSLCQTALYAQNGISIDVLQKDPYFSRGSTEEALEENPSSDIRKEDENDSQIRQTTNPADSSTFYNSQNWPGVIPGMKTSPNPNPDVPYGTQSAKDAREAEKNKKNEAPFTITNPNYKEDPTEADFLHDYWKKSWLEISLLYTPFYIPTFITENTLGKLLELDKTNYLNFLGAMANINFLPARFSRVKLGIALSGSYNALVSVNSYYTYFSNMVLANGELLMRILLGSSISLDLFAGGGVLMFLGTKFIYANNYESEPYNWFFPDVTGGLGMALYLTRYIGADARLQFSWPFKTDDPFPILQLGLGIGVRL